MSKDKLRDFATHLFVRAYVRSESKPAFLHMLLEAMGEAGEADEYYNDWSQNGFDDFLAILVGAKPEEGCAFAYTVLVKLLVDNMIRYDENDTDVGGDGPVWLKLNEIGAVNDDIRRKYAALELAVLEDARAELAAFDADEDDD